MEDGKQWGKKERHRERELKDEIKKRRRRRREDLLGPLGAQTEDGL